ncbi:MAG: RNA-binding protein [Lachnotalea sp.]
MERFEVGMLATSKAGHDKNAIYVIIGNENEYLYLVNGKNHLLENPKKKNIKHIQVIKHVDEDFQNKLTGNNKIQDEDIKRVIKLYGLELS